MLKHHAGQNEARPQAGGEPPVPQQGETGYSWLHVAVTLGSGVRVLTTTVVIALAAGILVLYTYFGNDASPDSSLGDLYAVIGATLLLYAALLFSVQRRLHRQGEIGDLRASLGWHMCFGIMGLAFLCMHSFGELNPRSGTYALYSLIALAISGLIGRLLDRLVPRLIASEVDRTLTAQGENRIETLSRHMRSAAVRHTHYTRSGQDPVAPDTEKINENLPVGAQNHLAELKKVQRALQRELCYRHIIRYWRRFHILLALLTVGLLIWHVVYALQLIFSTIGR